MQLKGSFAGSREQPGEMNVAQFKPSAWTVLNPLSRLEPAVPLRLWWESLIWPACSLGLSAAWSDAKWSVKLWGFFGVQGWILWNTLWGVLSLCVVTGPATIHCVVGKPWKWSVVSPGLQATAASIPERVQPTCSLLSSPVKWRPWHLLHWL